jgi:hypothetical protein
VAGDLGIGQDRHPERSPVILNEVKDLAAGLRWAGSSAARRKGL